jgi:hypothetical protein
MFGKVLAMRRRDRGRSHLDERVRLRHPRGNVEIARNRLAARGTAGEPGDLEQHRAVGVDEGKVADDAARAGRGGTQAGVAPRGLRRGRAGREAQRVDRHRQVRADALPFDDGGERLEERIEHGGMHAICVAGEIVRGYEAREGLSVAGVQRREAPQRRAERDAAFGHACVQRIGIDRAIASLSCRGDVERSEILLDRAVFRARESPPLAADLGAHGDAAVVLDLNAQRRAFLARPAARLR